MLASFTRGEIVKRGYHRKNPEQEKFTHTFLDASGVAYIPDSKREWLCGVMAHDWYLNGEQTKCAISENVDPAKFTFCMDWDLNNGPGQPLPTSDELKAYSRTALKSIAKFDPPEEKDLEARRWVALRTPQFKMHPYFIGNVCCLTHLVTIRLLMLQDLEKEHGKREPPKNSWADVLDDCIYQSSLRAPLTAKFSTCDRCKGELKRMDAEKKSNKTTPTALKRMSSICPNRDCHHGRIWSGPKSVYQIDFVLRPDGTEDTELFDYLSQNPEAMLKMCTPWHWGKPLSGWQRPIGAELGKMPTKKKVHKALKLSEDASGKQEKSKTPTAYASSLRKELSDAEKEHMKQTKCGKMVTAKEEPFKMLQALLRDGKLGANYTRLELKSLWRNKKESSMYGKVGGPSQHLCEIAKREHGSSTIFLQVSNTIMGAAIYMRCWHKDCRPQQGPKYPLTGAEFYAMFPGAKAETAHKVIATPSAPKRRMAASREVNDENQQPSSSSMVPAKKRLKLAGADFLANLLSESGN